MIASTPSPWFPSRRRAQAADRQTILDGSRAASTRGATEFGSAQTAQARGGRRADERLGMVERTMRSRAKRGRSGSGTSQRFSRSSSV